jgi:hypothetical protein
MELEFLETLFLNRSIGNDYILMLVSFFFGAMGASAFVNPVFITKQFDIHSLSIAGKNEVRAVYGGFGLFMSIALIIALLLPELRNGVCLTVSFALGGMSFGRMISAIMDASISKLPVFYGTIEFMAALLILLS